MFYFSRREQVALVLLLAALVAAAGAMWWVGSRAVAPTESFFIDAPAAAASGEKVTVHVCGEVARPGLYSVAAGTRVNDVIRLAGGAKPDADLNAVNLAAEAVDGQQIAIPARAELAPRSSGATQTSAALVAKAPYPPPTQKLAPGRKININRATAQQMEQLPGIGPSYARKIVEYRARLKAETGQGFTRVEQLMEIPGIGPKRFADIKDHVTL